jgi:hypothetical protein
VNFTQRKKKGGEVPPCRICAVDPSMGQKASRAALESHSTQKPQADRMAATFPKRGQAGAEPGWRRKHLKRHQEEGRRDEKEERARRANSFATSFQPKQNPQQT